MTKKNGVNGVVFFILFIVFIAGGWIANDYVEQKRVEKFYSTKDSLSLSNTTVEMDTFEPREYVKIKSLSG
ncbi:hypothetical protein D7Z54_20155 [Salibacterium salarium]|uniref:Uncharacterized protein n=1 Tax=Salibacterium salarium TaxID=284579 RepID=A0A3R9QR27_9BACI|nr:hypothetical protein [Salibacterium salarium]RSL31553.1 hypothetical protein D7Z54_20155 [Salibacterium salarium]